MVKKTLESTAILLSDRNSGTKVPFLENKLVVGKTSNYVCREKEEKIVD